MCYTYLFNFRACSKKFCGRGYHVRHLICGGKGACTVLYEYMCSHVRHLYMWQGGTHISYVPTYAKLSTALINILYAMLLQYPGKRERVLRKMAYEYRTRYLPTKKYLFFKMIIIAEMVAVSEKG